MNWLIVLLATVLSCSLPKDNKFFEEFEVLKGINISLFNNPFREAIPSSKTCEIVQVEGTRASFERIDNFTCSLEDCQKWCYYNPNCFASLYGSGAINAYDRRPSNVFSCIRTSYAELIDSNRETFKNYKYRVFYRGGFMPYRGSQHCVDYAPKRVCNTFKQCGWRRGKVGYNDQIQGDSASGWCGRTKC